MTKRIRPVIARDRVLGVAGRCVACEHVDTYSEAIELREAAEASMRARSALAAGTPDAEAEARSRVTMASARVTMAAARVMMAAARETMAEARVMMALAVADMAARGEASDAMGAGGDADRAVRSGGS